ncbi:MAG: Crp/Fnr family transcriptional regulator [Myxococcales bacterium]|nr:Crp/Fnr family transcriptional regulator [Myxococcales bacterium]
MSSDPLFARFGREFGPNVVLFREGEPGGVMYVIQHGRVKIVRQFPSGERILATLGPGDFFGEMAILNNKARNATAVTLEAVRALEIDARTLETMVLGNGEIAVRLITRLARRLDSANALIEILLQQDPRLRVVLGLARAAEEFGVPVEGGGIKVPVQIAALAGAVGLDEGTVVDVLERLTRVRIIGSLGSEGWFVPDVGRLHEFAELLEHQRTRGSGLPPKPAAPTRAMPPTGER